MYKEKAKFDVIYNYQESFFSFEKMNFFDKLLLLNVGYSKKIFKQREII
tara:strand:- start:100 stop:246 length:147 start_codon:yes stop_codon:yes gene_type:complete